MGRFGLRCPVFLTDWTPVRPRFESAQPCGFSWLARAHAAAAHALDPAVGETEHQIRMHRMLERFGCSDGQIAKRGHELEDFLLGDWDRMTVFRLNESPGGADLATRMQFFSERCDDVLVRLYPGDHPFHRIPDLMIHVTCTGYVSPNPTQRLISLRGWQRQTQSTQAYHMGCYAAVPAIRTAAAHVLSGMAKRVDIVHNEMCTLHFDPTAHGPEQLVVQSLFADGHIGYSVTAEGGSLRVLSLGEEVIPDSSGQMTWTLGAEGFRMTLGRMVPATIAGSVRDFVAQLFEDAGLSLEKDLPRCRAALHPGGPRIIDGLAEVLSLDELACADSREVLRTMGNMSSATLPHILHRIAQDPAVGSGTPVLGLAFGPGLTMAGSLAVKV
jgi:predicted naringenin-chalcone synthase